MLTYLVPILQHDDNVATDRYFRLSLLVVVAVVVIVVDSMLSFVFSNLVCSPAYLKALGQQNNINAMMMTQSKVVQVNACPLTPHDAMRCAKIAPG